MKKFSSIYAIIMGVCMIGMWVMFFVADSVPEIHTKPVELGMHVLAEIVTAILLVISGVRILLKKQSVNLYLFSMGMLIYTLIMSPGYFIEQGEIGFTIMFVGFLVLAICFVVYYFKKFKTK